MNVCTALLWHAFVDIDRCRSQVTSLTEEVDKYRLLLKKQYAEAEEVIITRTRRPDEGLMDRYRWVNRVIGWI